MNIDRSSLRAVAKKLRRPVLATAALMLLQTPVHADAVFSSPVPLVFSGAGLDFNGDTVQIINGASVTLDSSTVTLENGAVLSVGAISNFSLQNGSVAANAASIANAGTFNVDASSAVTGAGTYTQNGGTTLANGIISQSQIQILGGALVGTGTVSSTGNTNIGAGVLVRPGDTGLGALTLGGPVSFDGELDIQVNGASAFDVLNVLSGITFGSDALIKFLFSGYTPTAGNTFNFLSGTVIGNLPSFSISGLTSDLSYNLVSSNGGLQLVTQAAPSNVPEPLSAGLLGFGLVACAVLRRKGQGG